MKDGAAAIRALGDAIDAEGFLTVTAGNAAYEALVDRTGASAGEVPVLQGDGSLAFGSAGGQVVSGSYSGDGTTNRTVALAFTPKRVWVRWTDGTNHIESVSDIGDGGYAIQFIDSTPAKHNTNARRPRLTSGGFIVSGTGTGDLNKSGLTYYYVAIG